MSSYNKALNDQEVRSELDKMVYSQGATTTDLAHSLLSSLLPCYSSALCMCVDLLHWAGGQGEST